MADYKDTLNLPETAFPMRGNLPQREPEMLAFWEKADIYGKQRAAFADAPKFILHDGPPYANGAIHVGHALNKILKDIITKSRHLLGFNSPYIPGWDCHGLPIEQKVEQQIGKPGAKVSAAEFRAACRAYAASQIELQKADFIRLGVFGDWAHPYLTMQPQTEAGIVRALQTPTANLHLPAAWCLPDGVYVVQVAAPQPGAWHWGVANVGTTPTFGGIRRKLEVHVFEQNAALYGQTLRVHIRHFLRSTRRFAEAAALQAQIRQDIADTRFFIQQEQQHG